MLILGICDSHDAHACLLRDGVLVAAMAEERLSRLKADMGYPRRAIEAVLKMGGVTGQDLDLVAFSGMGGINFQVLYKMNALFSVKDWIKQAHGYWKPKLLDGADVSELDDFELFRHLRDDWEDEPYACFIERAKNLSGPALLAEARKIRQETAIAHLGIGADKIRFFRHEDCHKAYGFHSAPFRAERALVLTAEGSGDDSSATASTMTQDGRIDEHWRSSSVQLGRLYRYITLLLGMKPSQHEYKVMGLAPYSAAYHGARSLEYFRTVNKVVGTEIHNQGLVKELYFTSRDALEGERFDGIAWGLQTWIEEMLCEWTANNCEAHGLDTVIFSGGVAQNIKACKALLELPQVNRFWAGPVSGDGSLAIGACWLASRALSPETPIEGLPTTYLGTSYDARAIARAIDASGAQKNFTVVEKAAPDMVAGWLADGKIVARYAGRMEFGQRALGNRSILADPRHADTIDHINRKVKYRDFWMPFTPSMHYDEAERMLVNPKKVFSPFMTMAFALKPGAEREIPAAIHPADKTARPQMLREEDNPGYHALIGAFRRRTGLGVLLNTSFNLHNEPIVESPEDAISTFERSEIDVVMLDDVAIVRGRAE